MQHILKLEGDMNLQFDKLLVFSDENQKYFLSTFGTKSNIVYGRNTSGKSTLFNSVLYSLGINDNNVSLKEILDHNVLFRLDCTLTVNSVAQKITFLREDETLLIKREGFPTQRFNGINGNNSVEHIRLKEFIHDIFNYQLFLESKNEYKEAPIETLFLPYYVSQAVGWVYLRKSFSNLDYFRNFKEDYLDYYLGISTFIDRTAKRRLENELKSIQSEISFLTNVESNDEHIQLAKIADERFVETSNTYIESYTHRHSELTKKENDYVLLCNELGFFQQRQAVLRKVSKQHQKQNLESGTCPSCNQHLPVTISAAYKYFQEENDTNSELGKYRERIKAIQSKINSLQKSIREEKLKIEKEYNIFSRYVHDDVTVDTWLNNKSQIKLANSIAYKLGKLAIARERVEENLSKFANDGDIDNLRREKNREFWPIFSTYLNELGVRLPVEERYKQLYWISAFPSQGVELHKTVMAYHFAFNKLVKQTSGIHRFPLMLDAIFKEDIEQVNKDLIMGFISKNRPEDTQIIISIAEVKSDRSEVEKYNREYFDGKANMIYIGGGVSERSFLSQYQDEENEYIKESLDILNGLI